MGWPSIRVPNDVVQRINGTTSGQVYTICKSVKEK
jgi:hypothetical protein